MAKFKKGDRVKKRDGTAFSNGEQIVTVGDYRYHDGPFFDETKTWHPDVGLELVEPTPASPIRLVTRREIVPGTYGIVEVMSGNRVYVQDSNHTANDLRAAAALFDEIADVLDENAKAGEVG